MSKQIKVSEDVWADLMKMDGSASDNIRKLLDGKGGGDLSSLHKRFDDLGAYLEKKFKEVGTVDVLDAIDKKQSDPKPIPKELDGLSPGDLPECCQEAIQDGELGPLCSHWKMTYNNYGQTDYKNTLTGRFMSDPIYNKYV